MTQTTNGDGGAARPPDRAEIQRLVQAAAEQAAKALKAADRVAAGLAAAVQADADGMAAASREIEDALQAAGSDLLMAGALIQSHGWWLPENMQSIARLAQGLDADTNTDRNRELATIVIKHCDWLDEQKKLQAEAHHGNDE